MTRPKITPEILVEFRDPSVAFVFHVRVELSSSQVRVRVRLRFGFRPTREITEVSDYSVFRFFLRVRFVKNRLGIIQGHTNARTLTLRDPL